MRRTLGTLAVALLLTACSGDGSDESLAVQSPPTTAPPPPCPEVYAEGRPTADVVAATQCLAGQVLMQVVIGSYPCPDGRALHWNDDGWGYSDGPWHHHARPDGQLVPPDADLAACPG